MADADVKDERDWIVCEGELRVVSARRTVWCPTRGMTVAVRGCDDCRLLAWRRDERRRPAPCSTEPHRDVR